jgi:four helix bundle protein
MAYLLKAPRRNSMRVYHKAIEMNRELAKLAVRIGRQDPDLMRQLRRAASSVALNLAEGLGTRAGNRELRFQTALGSAREVGACLDVAEAWGQLGEQDLVVRDSVDHVMRMLVRLTGARR